MAISDAYTLRPIRPEDAREIAGWRYAAPYDVYNAAEGAEARLLDPRNAYYAVWVGERLAGFCCFGAEAQVPGGDYAAEALDVGVGMRPEWTGQGRGAAFFAAVLAFGQDRFAPERFRATVAAFNRRSQAMCARAGFQETGRFRRADGVAFVQLGRESR